MDNNSNRYVVFDNWWQNDDGDEYVRYTVPHVQPAERVLAGHDSSARPQPQPHDSLSDIFNASASEPHRFTHKCEHYIIKAQQMMF